MQHKISSEDLGPRAEPMVRAVEACVHCGFCLPTCPTYRVLEEEMDSPRGRIFLMKEVLEGNIPVEQVFDYVDRCLGCVACETSCPSGVQYGELITPFRAYAERNWRRGWTQRALRWIVLRTLTHPGRFRLAATLGRLTFGWTGRRIRRIFPSRVRVMLDLLPVRLPRAEALPEVFPAEGKRRARVALLAGCAQQVLAPEINWATLRVLARNGVEVVIPREQGCCGALSMHTGMDAQAKRLARRNLTAFPDDVDAILTNAAGCGSGMKEYALLFKGEPEEGAAREFEARVQDVSVFLDALGFEPPPAMDRPLKIAYHDACHLGHAQGVRAAPRRLLEAIPGVTVVTPPDWEICCGSAGIYNIERPEIAAELGRQKVESLLSTGADAVATGNIGCTMQIRTHLAEQQRELPVYHTFEVLDRAYAR